MWGDLVEGRPCLGVDFGGVIVPSSQRGDDRGESFLDAKFQEALNIAPARGCVDGLNKLTPVFSGRVWIISKASPPTVERTWAWLGEWNFLERAGIDASRIRFCGDRAAKAEMCRILGVTHYVDDQLAVLELLRECVAQRFLFSEDARAPVPQGIIRVRDWYQLVEAVVKTLAP